MKINAIAIKTMILMLVKISLQRNYHIFTAVYADDLTTSGPIGQLKIWWNAPCKLSPKFGYPEGSKLRSVIRKTKNAEEHAQSIFQHTKIKITSEGKRHLGAVVRTKLLKKSPEKKVD